MSVQTLIGEFEIGIEAVSSTRIHFDAIKLGSTMFSPDSLGLSGDTGVP